MADQHYNFLKRNKINLIQFVFGPFQENTYIIWEDGNQNAVAIDPGMSNSQEERIFLQALHDFHLKLTAIYNTHCHIDHILGVAFLQRQFHVPFYHHPLEENNIVRSEQMSTLWNIPFSAPIDKGNDLVEGTALEIGTEVLTTIFVPGHCTGHLAFIHHASGTILSGDVLFRESIGRTDLPGGSIEEIQMSIYRLYEFPDDYVVFSGHGPATTIGHEKKHNPFFPAP